MKGRYMIPALAAALTIPFAVTKAPAQRPSLPTCSALAGELLKNKDISAASSVIQPAAGGHLAYCSVSMTVSALQGSKDGYLPGQKQMIGIAIGLPLSSADGGSGSVQGAWNGRVFALGEGGFAGSVTPPISATDIGYVGSDTDTGHSAASGGTFALNPDGTLNWGFIRDFGFNGIHYQAVWSKQLAQMYYGEGPKFSYFSGCSGGGREAYQLAQTYPEDFDGILAGSAGNNWDRAFPGLGWAQVVMNQEVGAPISLAKLTAVTQAAIKACDALDGIVDGLIQDPRACHYKASASACTGDPTTCLTSEEASAVNKIWDGTPGREGIPLWFGLERGAILSGLAVPGLGETDVAGQVPFALVPQYFQYWVIQNPAFDWHTITEKSFDQVFRESEQKFHELAADNPDLSAFKDRGGKLIGYHGLADPLLPSRMHYNYYNRVTKAQGGLRQTQKFYRFFPYPGWGHCGLGGSPNAPQANTNDLLDAMVKWVEHGTAPDSIVAYNGATLATSTTSRPICKYPDTLVYNGNGSTNDASNFHCQVQTTDPLMAAESVLPDPYTSGDGNNDNEAHNDR